MSKWKLALLGIGLFLLWFYGLFAMGERGYDRQYFWASECLIALSFAVAPFWRLRTTRWYWAAILLLVPAHLGALYAKWAYISDSELPSKGIFKGIVVLDCMASWCVMVGICWLTTRRLPWQQPPQ